MVEALAPGEEGRAGRIAAVKAPAVGAGFDAPALRRGIETYAAALAAHRDAINRLNVYPVPDGDTGTNMALTVRSVVDELAAAPDAMAPVCAAIAQGSLMGARGNSGVILSQILRALAAAFTPHEAIDAATAAAALRDASQAADRAVVKPVEGTILTVMRDAAGAAERAARRTGERAASTAHVFEAALDEARAALARTPEQLAVLKDAGVVDAGGAGLVLLFEALLHVLDGRPVSEPPAGAPGNPARVAAVSVEGPRFEVMYLLRVDDAGIDQLKSRWSELGDSIVVVGGDGLYNCHVHTDDVGAAIEVALDLGGRPSKIRVSDLYAEAAEHDWVREAGGEPAGGGVGAAPVPVTTAVVAVGVGDGIARILRSMGVQAIVTGGQSMNPSTADLVAAIDAVAAPSAIVLPNNRNIVPVAEQAAPVASKHVLVVPTRSVAEGLASLVAYDPEASVEANAEAMTAAAQHVATGEVTRAVRDATSRAGEIRTGDYLGVSRAGIAAVAASALDATKALLCELIHGEHELVTIIAGADANPGDTEALVEWLGSEHPELTVESHYGGQPLYLYYLGVE